MIEIVGLIGHYIATNSTACVVVLGLIGTAFASTFPENRPKTLDDLWAWFRDFVHQLANAKRPTANPTTPPAK